MRMAVELKKRCKMKVFLQHIVKSVIHLQYLYLGVVVNSAVTGRRKMTANKALVRTQTTLRFVCAAQLGR